LSALNSDLRALLWCAAAFLAAVLLHLGRVPLWAIAIAALCGAWSVAIATRRMRAPGRIVKGVLAFALVALVIAVFHTLNGLVAGTTLLAGMGSFKLLETSKRRDRYIVIATALFLLIAACLSQQGLVYAPLYAGQAWLCCSALLIVTHPESPLGSRAAVLFTARTLLLAVPIAVLGFLFFPRLAGSFWALPSSGAGITGLSDTMSPGAISDLSQSTDPAFRVWFDGAPPPPAERYWRGPVLHYFDGNTWFRAPLYGSGSGEPTAPLGRAYHYRVTLEPSSQHWWFALDTVDESPSPLVRLTADRVLVTAHPVIDPVTYQAVSHTSIRNSGALPYAVRQRELQAAPPDRNPRALGLARRLRAQAPSDAAFVGAVLGFFRVGGFAYTLRPPQLGDNSVDDFLFGTRRGFCGHYASAFVMLMRAGGVPSRVVTGYQGGEWNPIGGYLLVRQSDAHAWAEVWLEGRGWTRVDPTAVVAPERLTQGILDFLPNAASAPERLMLRVPWLASVRQTWDAANAWWTNRVIGFNLKSQLGILHRLGFATPRPSELVWLLACGLGAWLAVTAWQLGLPRSTRPDRLARAYRRLCLKLARVGAPRAPHLGPMAYAEAIVRQRPELAEATRPLLAIYAELRYGALLEQPSAARATRLAEFERGVARLRVARATRAPASRER
jgi:protein-glutamine gamma-glutamyltransferase